LSPLNERLKTKARRAGLTLGALSLLAYFLIVLGAVVRAKGAGLACPDWPLCFGQAIPPFDTRIALEWAHRVLASVVSLGLAGTSVFVLRTPALRRLTARSLVLTWLLLATQVVLGGLTVLLGLAPWTVTAHLLVGNAVCGAMLWTSRDLIEAGRTRLPPRLPLSAPGASLLALFSLLLVAQILLGGMVSSNLAGLACSTFPTCNGDSIAPSFSGLIGIHVLHRLNGCALALGCAALAWLVRGSGRVGALAALCLHLVLLQIVVGAVNVLAALPVEITALHSALAAALVIAALLLTREALLAQREAVPAAKTHGRVVESVG
jgi:cytochrome c oxidase assembly protein subunit 15